jgi:NAD(P)H-dependent FMN reductase
MPGPHDHTPLLQRALDHADGVYRDNPAFEVSTRHERTLRLLAELREHLGEMKLDPMPQDHRPQTALDVLSRHVVTIEHYVRGHQDVERWRMSTSQITLRLDAETLKAIPGIADLLDQVSDGGTSADSAERASTE